MIINKLIKIGFCTFVLGSFAHATDSTESNATSTNAVKKGTPANWWQMGSYGYPQTDELLTHFAGTLSYMRSKGNEENSNFRISTLAIARQGHFTFANSYTKHNWTRRIYDNKDSAPRELNNERYKVETNLFYDINSYFFGAVGYENGRNLEMAIYNQTIRYGGVGIRAIQTPKQKLSLFVGYGDEDISYELYPILPAGKTDLIYYQLNYLWLMNDNFSLNGSYTLLKADMKYRDTSKLDISTTTKISKYLSLVVAYQDLSVKALDTVNLFTHDKSVSTSIKLSF